MTFLPNDILGEHPADHQPEAFNHEGTASYHGTERLCNRCRVRPYENRDTGLCRYCTKDTGRERMLT